MDLREGGTRNRRLDALVVGVLGTASAALGIGVVPGLVLFGGLAWVAYRRPFQPAVDAVLVCVPPLLAGIVAATIHGGWASLVAAALCGLFVALVSAHVAAGIGRRRLGLGPGDDTT